MFQYGALATPGSQVISSGYRPGAITSSGNPSLHGIPPPWNAVDVVGANMVQFAQTVAAKFGRNIRELIHTPLGWGIKNGQRVSLGFWGPEVNAAHYSHVHLAEHGWHGEVRQPTLFLAGEAGRERVDISPRMGQASAINVSIGGPIEIVLEDGQRLRGFIRQAAFDGVRQVARARRA